MDLSVAALGLLLVTLAGYVWYVPAVLTLRAGADRPVSQRMAATACVTAWGTTAALAATLFLSLPAAVMAAVGAAGYSAATTVRLRAVLQSHRERAEDAREWASLLQGGAHS
jgi:hypothetical protein